MSAATVCVFLTVTAISLEQTTIGVVFGALALFLLGHGA